MPYRDILELPPQVEIAIRSGRGKDYIFLLNYMPYDIEINVKKPMTDLISGKSVIGSHTIEKYGVMVLANQK